MYFANLFLSYVLFHLNVFFFFSSLCALPINFYLCICLFVCFFLSFFLSFSICSANLLSSFHSIYKYVFCQFIPFFLSICALLIFLSFCMSIFLSFFLFAGMCSVNLFLSMSIILSFSLFLSTSMDSVNLFSFFLPSFLSIIKSMLCQSFSFNVNHSFFIPG
ncbi:unnamed protein product [Acanthosepion pharaonis]|uniref:Uncharacterized protein n=1 Tax=Acanthosepion pharaonis TaxID=158019 RepID=A0A812C4J7_ACAPH|nr:unnamed protein product [Sepia pharaonis]